MPVSAVTPYVPEPKFSEDGGEEIHKIIASINQTLLDELTTRQLAKLQVAGHKKPLKLTDWSAIINVSDVSLSRYSSGDASPAMGTVQFFRVLHERISQDPSKGVSALMDYAERANREVPDLESEIDLMAEKIRSGQRKDPRSEQAREYEQ